MTVPPLAGRHGEKGGSGGFFISVQLDVEGAWADQPLAEPEAQAASQAARMAPSRIAH